MNIQCFATIALAFTDLTWNKNIGQEMHFNFNDTIALTGFATASAHIETKPACFVSTHFGLVGRSKQVANVVEDPRIGSRIGTRSTTNGGLVNINNLIQFFHTEDFIVITGTGFCSIQHIQ
ncbi:hypothetical protein SDC9_103070 [bioreactor metagenome]|uniref:Uncharacterized protein n=1 Tax=bioreactor metagenome TaxID=1076179 RepID=A0A645AU32_9ZZZZ